MAYHVYSQVDDNIQSAVKKLKDDVIAGINAGWECQGGVSVSGSTPDGHYALYTASQAMVKKAPQEGGKRLPKTPTRPSLPRPLPKSRGRRTRKNRK